MIEIWDLRRDLGSSMLDLDFEIVKCLVFRCCLTLYVHLSNFGNAVRTSDVHNLFLDSSFVADAVQDQLSRLRYCRSLVMEPKTVSA